MPSYLVLTETGVTAEEALPALVAAGIDAKAEPFDTDVARILDLAPAAVFADAASTIDAGTAFATLSALRTRAPQLPTVAIVGTTDALERYAWHEVADEIVSPDVSEAELRVRLAMLRRRNGGTDEAEIRLGPLGLNTQTYRVAVDGRPLDLTYKEFELLRFLCQRPGLVFTREALLREVWGYDFYGGTRTVDVHVRRLRAKLGPEHEHLIETVRGVGYRASDLVP
jgi:DNA-binding response OmpR family regulator